MSPWSKASDVAEVEIQSDQESAVSNHPTPEELVRGSREPLADDGVGVVAAPTQQFEVWVSEILVELDEKGVHRSGIRSSSLARSAAYAIAARTSSETREG